MDRALAIIKNGNAWSLRIAASICAHLREARVASPAPMMDSTTHKTMRTGCGAMFRASWSMATAPARSANEVRIHAKKVRSFARENL